MTPIVKRLKSWMEKNDMNALQLSHLLGYKQSEKIYRLFREENSTALPSAEILEDISNKFENLDIRWLLTGHISTNLNASQTNKNMELFEGEAEYNTKPQIIEALQQANAALIASNADKDKIIALLEKQLKEVEKLLEYASTKRKQPAQ